MSSYLSPRPSTARFLHPLFETRPDRPRKNMAPRLPPPLSYRNVLDNVSPLQIARATSGRSLHSEHDHRNGYMIFDRESKRDYTKNQPHTCPSVLSLSAGLFDPTLAAFDPPSASAQLLTDRDTPSSSSRLVRAPHLPRPQAWRGPTGRCNMTELKSKVEIETARCNGYPLKCHASLRVSQFLVPFPGPNPRAKSSHVSPCIPFPWQPSRLSSSTEHGRRVNHALCPTSCPSPSCLSVRQDSPKPKKNNVRRENKS